MIMFNLIKSAPACRIYLPKAEAGSINAQLEKIMAIKYWLFKSEERVFSIHDLSKETGQTTHWNGIRNYQARNFIRDEMKNGDKVLYYHSNSDPNAVVGV
jgi:hypothetical protein